MSILTTLRAFAAEYSDIMEHGRTGRMPARRARVKSTARTAPHNKEMAGP